MQRSTSVVKHQRRRTTEAAPRCFLYAVFRIPTL